MQTLVVTSRILGVLALLHFLQEGVAWACSCPDLPASTEEMLEAYEMVFVGKVLGPERRAELSGCSSRRDHTPDGDVPTRVEVIEAFRGVEEGDIVAVRHGAGDEDCGTQMRKGERWVLFMNEDLGSLAGYWGMCHPGGPHHRFEDTIQELRVLTAR